MLNTPLLRFFFAIAIKRRRAFGQLFRNFSENFRSRSPKVRSPGQVKWPHLRNTSQSRHGHSDWEKDLKLSGYRYTTKYLQLVYVGFFYIGDLSSGQFRNLPIMSMGKNSNVSNTDQICANRSEPCLVRLLLMTSVQNCISDSRKGHLWSNNGVMRSMYVFAYNFWLAWDRDLGKVFKCSPCPDASNDMQHVRSPFDLDLRAKNEVDLSR